MGISNPKSNRVLELYDAFLSGKVVNKQELAILYNVTERSIQRDIDTIRAFLAEQLQDSGISRSIVYDRSRKGYRLVTHKPGEL